MTILPAYSAISYCLFQILVDSFLMQFAWLCPRCYKRWQFPDVFFIYASSFLRGIVPHFFVSTSGKIGVFPPQNKAWKWGGARWILCKIGVLGKVLTFLHGWKSQWYTKCERVNITFFLCQVVGGGVYKGFVESNIFIIYYINYIIYIFRISRVRTEIFCNVHTLTR